MSDKKWIVKISAYIVAIIGWLVLIAFCGGMILLVGFVAYQEISKTGVWYAVRYAGTVLLGVIAFFAILAIWIASCNYVGWGDD